MPTYDDYPENETVKVLYLGDSGTGKTGSLVSLAAGGYTVRVLDLDGGGQIIRDYVTNPASPYRQAKPGLWTAEQAKTVASRISYVTIIESIQKVQDRPVPKGDSWGRVMTQLDRWRDGDKDYGGVGTWGADTVLVVDSLSRLSKGAWYYQLKLGGRLLSRPEQSDWWAAQDLIEKVLIQLTTLSCHVIIVCHLDYIERDDGLTRGMPMTIGKALSPRVGQNYNHAILAKTSGQGTGMKRKIMTNTTGVIDLKTSAPLRVAPEYDLGTGLLEYFRAVLPRTQASASPHAKKEG